MGFSVKVKSVDGYFVGNCSPISTLSDATHATPGSSTASLIDISFSKYYADAVAEWNSYYEPAITHLPGAGANPMGNFINYLEDHGYTSVSNPLDVAVFDIVDSYGAITNKQLVLSAYMSNFQQFTHFVRKREFDGTNWTYTTISNSRTEVLADGFTDFGMIAGTTILNSRQYYLFGFAVYKNGEGTNKRAGAVLWGDPTDEFSVVLGGGVPGEKDSPEFGPASEPGGGYNEDTPSSEKGTFDDTSDKITPSSKPTLTPLSSNLVHAYKVDVQTLNDIANAIYVDLANDWSSIETALEAIYNAIFAAKYVDYLLDLLILPINVPAPNLVDVKVGGKYLTLSSGRVQSYLVTDPYVDFDCGSVSIPEYWANFLDYTGTKVKLFLPYIGYVDIQPEYVINGELNVKYRFNVLDGSFIVHVLSTSGKSQLEESMIGQYAGVAAVHVPLQASDYATKVSGLISAIGTVAAGMAAGGVGAMAGAANLGNTLMQKPGSTHANGYNASSSYLSHRCPYLIIERQVSQFSEKYMEEVGLPLNVMRTLGSMSGLTKCEAAHLDTIPCSVEGKEKISRLMKSGIIL